MDSPSPLSPTSSFHQNTELSIYQLVRRYCRERLIVDPSLWTIRHVELLGFEFQDAVPAAPLEREHNPAKDTLLLRYIQRLCISNGSATRHGMFFGILGDKNAPFQALENLHFYFNNRHVRVLPCVVFFPGDDRMKAGKGQVPPIAAYVDSTKIDEIRRDGVRGVQGTRYHKPGVELYRIKLQKITPPNAFHDPYIVALLIGVAQRQQHALEGRNTKPPTFLSYVFFTKKSDNKYLHLFSADIPSSLLAKLDNPSIPPLNSSSILIRHTTIPFLPYDNFRDRVLSLLHPPAYTEEFKADSSELNDAVRLETLQTREPLHKGKYRKRPSNATHSIDFQQAQMG